MKRARWTDEGIAVLAEKIRKYMNLAEWMPIDVLALIRNLQEDPRLSIRVDFVETAKGHLRGYSAKTDPKKRIIYYVNGLLQRLKMGDTIAAAIFLEEIGHVFLHPEAELINHADAIDARVRNLAGYADMEEEAEKFVFYTFAPIAHVYSETDYRVLVANFGMPESLARKYVAHLEDTRNRIEGKSRTLPDKVVQFQKTSRPDRGNYYNTISKKKIEADSYLTMPFSTSANANRATIQHNPAAPFLDEKCSGCGQKTVRIVAGCKQCLCGEDYGCN